MGAAVALCFLVRESEAGREVLLGRKMRGLGQGMVVGLGGHVEPGETPAEAAVRELAEEAGVVLDLAVLAPAGTGDFRFPARPAWDMECTMFTAAVWDGEIAESEEIAPSWYPVEDLPLEAMWQDADHWLPLVLGGTVADFYVEMAEDNETVFRFAVLGP